MVVEIISQKKKKRQKRYNNGENVDPVDSELDFTNNMPMKMIEKN